MVVSLMKPIVYVKWEDHWAEDESWVSLKRLLKKFRANEDVYIETVGFILDETDKSILVGLNVSSDGQVDGNIIILKCNILERVALQLPVPVGTFATDIPTTTQSNVRW